MNTSGPPPAGPAPRPGLVRALRFGALELRTNLFLSPLAGYTNLPFRLAVRALGGLHLCTTDLVNVRSLLRRNPVALQLVATAPADAPLAVQLFGADPVEMRDAAQMLEGMGMASVDINMGCPVDKVVRTGSGSLLMTSPQQAAALVAAMVDGVKIPVTAKMRLGWDHDDLSAPDLAGRLEDAGAAAVFVHGRTRAQGFSGRVDLRGIRAVAQAVRRIPVIGNGDVTTPAAARRMFEETGCAGVSIGRGAFYDPWIFRNTIALLERGEAPHEPSFAERLAFMRGHLAHSVAFYGEEKGCVRFRRIAPWYLRNTGPTLHFRQRIQDVRDVAGFDALVESFVDWRGRFLDPEGGLLPYYRPTAVRTVFAGDEGDEGDGEMRIAVPKGPIAAW